VQPTTTLDLQNLARTFRLVAFVSLQDTKTAAPEEAWNDSKYSDPFTVVMPPTAFLQMNVLPYTIVYQPPGDQSTGTFTTSNTYGTTFSLGNTSDASNKYSSLNSGSAKASLKLGFSLLNLSPGISQT
jgi:hypothetical protein